MDLDFSPWQLHDELSPHPGNMFSHNQQMGVSQENTQKLQQTLIIREKLKTDSENKVKKPNLRVLNLKLEKK